MKKELTLLLQKNDLTFVFIKVMCTKGKSFISKKTKQKMTEYSFKHPFKNKMVTGTIPETYFN